MTTPQEHFGRLARVNSPVMQSSLRLFLVVVAVLIGIGLMLRFVGLLRSHTESDRFEPVGVAPFEGCFVPEQMFEGRPPSEPDGLQVVHLTPLQLQRITEIVRRLQAEGERSGADAPRPYGRFIVNGVQYCWYMEYLFDGATGHRIPRCISDDRLRRMSDRIADPHETTIEEWALAITALND